LFRHAGSHQHGHKVHVDVGNLAVQVHEDVCCCTAHFGYAFLHLPQRLRARAVDQSFARRLAQEPAPASYPLPEAHERLVPVSHWNLPSIWALLHSEGVRTRSSNSTPQRIARRAEGQESQQAPYSAEAHAKTSVDTSYVAICHLPPNCAPEAWLVAQGSLAASSSLLLQCTPH
jgi:hypothetical protein